MSKLDIALKLHGHQRQHWLEAVMLDPKATDEDKNRARIELRELDGELNSPEAKRIDKQIEAEAKAHAKSRREKGL